MADVLYEDKFISVTSNGVCIKWYWFPTAHSKVVPFAGLHTIISKPEQVLSPLNSKTWGMGIGTVWWACDMSSLGVRHKKSMVLRNSSFFGHGFSCEDRERALAAIRQGVKAAGVSITEQP